MSTPEQVLKHYFGYSSFRGQQKKLIDALLEGQDVLAVMPTGAGKSICYQIPSLLVSGLTIVICPLISLMKDQVSALNSNGIPAAYLSSTLSIEERKTVFAMAYANKLKLLYVSPERLLADGLINLCQNIKINYVAVDEAHCISQWGQDFRPSYSKIHEFLQALPERPPVGAFTATATNIVRQDIIKFLELNNPLCVVSGFDRPNLTFITEQPRDKFEHLVTLLNERHFQSGIVYCTTRKMVDELYEKLSLRGFKVGCYHAGMLADERKAEQDTFLFDDTKIMIATNAFGMGIDKPNVGFVIHYQMPQSMESYYQEAGRAGRDGNKADCILLFEPKDVKICEFLIKHGYEDNNELDTKTKLVLMKRQLKKLEIITEYSTTNKCLRHFILDYFGESSEDNCMNCSNCSAHFTNEDATIDAQKVVSCVFRLAERKRSVGKTTISEILQGVQSERTLRSDFTSLSTFGIMRNCSVKYIHRLIDALIKDGYLELEKNPYPIIKLCKKSGEIICDRKPFFLHLPKDNYAIKYNSLYESLRSVRGYICAKENIKPEDVVSNIALEQLCIKLPENTDKMRQIPEISDQQINLYGELFLKYITPYITKQPLSKTFVNAQKISRNSSVISNPWTKQEDDMLKEFSELKIPISEISKNINRPISTVIARMKLLCLPIIR